MVDLMSDRRAEGTWGRRGKRVCSSLSCQLEHGGIAPASLLDGIDDLLVPQHDQVSDDCSPDIASDGSRTH
jgi:hypothetical protein